ncbi:MAG: Mur ligase domain-containing protein [Planctomycetota bacterium]
MPTRPPIPSPLHFTGLGGIGMSAIAQVLAARGLRVSGSDRSFDKGERAADRRTLQRAKIRVAPQDGSGVTRRTKALVVSTAIESGNPDIETAKVLGVPILHRSLILARIAASGPSAAVAGTSGKSTTAGILGFLLEAACLAPTVVNGAPIADFEGPAALGNARTGRAGGPVVIEADESDGTLSAYRPAVSILTSLGTDHKGKHETLEMFARLARNTKGHVLGCGDDPEIRRLVRGLPRGLLYGEHAGADFRLANVRVGADGTRWRFLGREWFLPMIGKHNALNASAAIAAAALFVPGGARKSCEDLGALSARRLGAGARLALPVSARSTEGRRIHGVGPCSDRSLRSDPRPEPRSPRPEPSRARMISDEDLAAALARFRGVRRRLERVGAARGVVVFDDFAHNGQKIAAALAALKPLGRRLFAVFQPHGFGPARAFGRDWAAAFASALGPKDRVFLLPIFDAGGTADRSVSSDDLLPLFRRKRIAAAVVPRASAPAALARIARKGDIACVLGARDPSLPTLARAILRAIRKTRAG